MGRCATGLFSVPMSRKRRSSSLSAMPKAGRQTRSWLNSALPARSSVSTTARMPPMEAEDAFNRLFLATSGARRDVRMSSFPPIRPRPGTIGIVALVRLAGFAGTNSEARRLVEQGGVSLDGEKVTDGAGRVPGQRRFGAEGREAQFRPREGVTADHAAKRPASGSACRLRDRGDLRERR